MRYMASQDGGPVMRYMASQDDSRARTEALVMMRPGGEESRWHSRLPSSHTA